jgi:nucleoside-diphosphate-sugar epimerase
MEAAIMSTRVLITGAQGFVGRYTAAEFLRSGTHEVLGIGRTPEQFGRFTHKVTVRGVPQQAVLTSQLKEAFAGSRFRYQQADINDQRIATVIGEFRPDCVVHLAATRREETAENLIRGNVGGICSLIEACATARVRRLVLGSSAAVYGTSADGALPLKESEVCVPADAYGASKLAGEHFARVLCARNGIELVIGRIFNVVGPAQEERHVCGRIASELASVLGKEGPATISLAGLSATRDYIDVRDVASALRLLATSGASDEIYNLASGVEFSVGDIFNLFRDFANLRSRVAVCEVSGGGIPRHFASVAKLNALGFCPHFDLPASLKDVLDYYLKFHLSTTDAPAQAIQQPVKSMTETAPVS